MTLAVLDNVKKRIIDSINANPGVWSNVVSGDVGAFASDPALLAAILEADEMIVTRGYFPSINRALAQPFMAWSMLGNREKLPFFHGKFGKVELAQAVKAFVDGAVSASNNTITLTAHGLAVGAIISLLSSGTLPAGLVANTDYFVIVVDADTIKLASSYSNALAGTPIDITSASGGGNHTLIPWLTGIAAKNMDSITNILAVGSYTNPRDYDFLYNVTDGVFYHPAQYGRIEIPTYTRTSTLQALQSEESLIIATTIRLLTRNASPAPFEVWTNESLRGIQELITDGAYTPKMG